MRRALTAGLAAAVLLTVPGAAADATGRPSLGQLRSQRAVLVRQIARVTDVSIRAQARAVAAQRRRFFADLAADVARRKLVRYAVDAYVSTVASPEADRLRGQVFADVTSAADRAAFQELRRAEATADAELAVAEGALGEAQAATNRLRALRAQLETTIAEREAADPDDVEARRLATPGAKLTTRPRYRQLTRYQADLFSRYPFGPVIGVPEGLTPTGEVLEGVASWYGPGFDGRPTASGAIFDQEGFTVAHRTLPLGTILVIHRGDRSVLVLVNDRGPFVGGRVLDLSHGVAAALGTVQAGIARVTAEVLVPTS
jgi:rare lipoprotein A (peptidoglycan hydrolase)